MSGLDGELLASPGSATDRKLFADLAAGVGLVLRVRVGVWYLEIYAPF